MILGWSWKKTVEISSLFKVPTGSHKQGVQSLSTRRTVALAAALYQLRGTRNKATWSKIITKEFNENICIFPWDRSSRPAQKIQILLPRGPYPQNLNDDAVYNQSLKKTWNVKNQLNLSYQPEKAIFQPLQTFSLALKTVKCHLALICDNLGICIFV